MLEIGLILFKEIVVRNSASNWACRKDIDVLCAIVNRRHTDGL